MRSKWEEGLDSHVGGALADDIAVQLDFVEDEDDKGRVCYLVKALTKTLVSVAAEVSDEVVLPLFHVLCSA